MTSWAVPLGVLARVPVHVCFVARFARVLPCVSTALLHEHHSVAFLIIIIIIIIIIKLLYVPHTPMRAGCLDNDDGSSWYKITRNFCVYGGHKRYAATRALGLPSAR